MTPAADTQPKTPAAPRQPASDADHMLRAIDALRAELAPRLANGLVLKRDNPGETPQQWSVGDGADPPILIFGLIDRTFFWSWDGGVSNHYAKNAGLMTRIIIAELARFGHLT